ncbi:hypothetical protein Gasu2_30630 [Galdieria sulphuraria]|nr:hypothetical protein Gasu2_30630 [Galdieria sulphuraria]
MGFLCHNCIVSAWNISLLNSSTCARLSKSFRSWQIRHQTRIKTCFPKQWVCCQSPVDPVRPRFRIREEEDSSPKQLQEDEIESINSQLKKEIEETRRRLGLEEKSGKPRKELLETDKVEDVSLWNVLIASVIASLLAVSLDMFALKVYSYVGSHPRSQTDMYIVERLSGVIRLVLVGFSSLAGGIVSIVALGLCLLFLQTSLKKLMGLFSS